MKVKKLQSSTLSTLAKLNCINKITTRSPKPIDAQQYKYEPKDTNFKALYHVMKRRESEIVTVSKTVQIKILGPGKLFGVEDFMSKSQDRKFSYSVTAKSLNCKIMIFNRDTAYQKLKIHDYTWH